MTTGVTREGDTRPIERKSQTAGAPPSLAGVAPALGQDASPAASRKRFALRMQTDTKIQIEGELQRGVDMAPSTPTLLQIALQSFPLTICPTKDRPPSEGSHGPPLWPSTIPQDLSSIAAAGRTRTANPLVSLGDVLCTERGCYHLTDNMPEYKTHLPGFWPVCFV